MDEECGEGLHSEEERHHSSFLSERDVPGAALNGRDPKCLTIPQLKRWLQCRNAPTKGKKGDLVAR